MVLKKDTIVEESLVVHGSIRGKDGVRYNLAVYGNISAVDISTRDIMAGDIKARDIKAGDIRAMDISAMGNISAIGDITYYAVCFAYYNIECNSIKGRRKNAKHFVLDGKITVGKKR